MSAPMQKSMLVNLPLKVDMLTPDIVSGFVDGGLVTVEVRQGEAQPFHARVTANENGPWFSGATLDAAVSAAWSFGIHHTAETESRAVAEGMMDLAESLAAKTDADVADIYDTTMESITDVDMLVPEMDAKRWPLLAAEDERRAVAQMPH